MYIVRIPSTVTPPKSGQIGERIGATHLIPPPPPPRGSMGGRRQLIG
jgi:hypothetical protein